MFCDGGQYSTCSTDAVILQTVKSATYKSQVLRFSYCNYPSSQNIADPFADIVPAAAVHLHLRISIDRIIGTGPV